MAFDRIPGNENLYIGGLFTLHRRSALQKAGITHILSVLHPSPSGPLQSPSPDLAGFKRLLVEVEDSASENILIWFESCNAFIQEGLDGGGGVLVHCVMGKSRSVTITIAYLLSTNTSLTPQTALALVRQCRPFAEPNSGFMAQLMLYHSMRCPVSIEEHPVYLRWLRERQELEAEVGGIIVAPNKSKADIEVKSGHVSRGDGDDDMIYQRWQYKCHVEECIADGKAPERIHFSDAVSISLTDSATLPLAETADHKIPPTSSFRCRRCSTSLGTSQSILPHTSSPSSTPCAHLFFQDPLSWMRRELEKGYLEGRLECPNRRCRGIVGKYAWQGAKCSCGEWVVPGISIARGRIDEIKGK